MSRRDEKPIPGMKECNCGRMVDNGASVCPNCGKRFTSPWNIIAAIVLVGLILFIIRACHS